MRGRAVILISMSSELNVGYYFHPQAVFGPNGTAKTEAHWGLFIRALAAELGQVTYYAHCGEGNGIENFELGPADHIRCVNLGPRHRRPLMFLFPWLCLRNFKPKADGLDAMIVRGPTALLPAISRKARRQGVVFLALLVDDTSNWKGKTGYPKWREKAIRLWLKIQAGAIARVGRKSLTMAISQSIVRDPRFRRTALVKTTSLSRADLTGPEGRTRAWPKQGAPIRLLYTGRIALEKGLLELCDAMETLVADGYNVVLELVGPLYDDPTLHLLQDRAAKAGLTDRMTFSGFLEAGPELLAAYQRSDVFVLATWGEGSVTRTIKEAFATGLPVVTTTVREIAEFLTDGEHAVLVPDHDAPALAKGIARMIDDPELRATVVKNGFEFVQEFTNERSAEIVAGHVRDEIRRGVEK